MNQGGTLISGGAELSSMQDQVSVLHEARQRDPIGHQIHTVLALVCLFTIPLTTAPKEIAFVALLGWALVRLPRTWRSYRGLMLTPVSIALVCWVGWQVLSMTWSADQTQGFDEISPHRMLLLPLALWPILDRLPWLIGAALAGVMAQNVAQLLQATEALNVRPHEGAGRFGGLINPIQTGAWCVAAMCWHVSGCLNGRGRAAVLSIIMLLIAGAGLIATESRGPWFAAAVALPLMVIVTSLRRPALRRRVAVVAGLGVLGCAAAWPFIGSQVTSRIADAAREAQQAKENGIYWTSVGLRIGMNKWAWSIFAEHPIKGVGAGGYPSAQAELPEFQSALAGARQDRQRRYMTRDHPHSMYLYTLACNGLIGAIFLGGVIIATLHRAWTDRTDHMYADGTFFALIGWLIGAQFDCYNLDGHRLGLLVLVIAASLPGRMPVRLSLSALHDRDQTASRAALTESHP